MQITFADIAERFEGVLSGALSREDADSWAQQIMRADDEGAVQFEPRSDYERIWRGVTYMCGIDLRDGPDTYLHTPDDIRESYRRLRDGPTA